MKAQLKAVFELKKMNKKIFVHFNSKFSDDTFTFSVSAKEFFNYCNKNKISAVAISEDENSIYILGK